MTNHFLRLASKAKSHLGTFETRYEAEKQVPLFFFATALDLHADQSAVLLRLQEGETQEADRLDTLESDSVDTLLLQKAYRWYVVSVILRKSTADR